jgi:hypothetical protein
MRPNNERSARAFHCEYFYVVAESQVPVYVPTSIRTSFFFINQMVNGGLYLANRCGGMAAVAGTMLDVWRVVNNCFAYESAVSASQFPQKVRALNTNIVSTGIGTGGKKGTRYCPSYTFKHKRQTHPHVRNITLRDLPQSDLGIKWNRRL